MIHHIDARNNQIEYYQRTTTIITDNVCSISADHDHSTETNDKRIKHTHAITLQAPHMHQLITENTLTTILAWQTSHQDCVQ